jgi:hypothetical protein
VHGALCDEVRLMLGGESLFLSNAALLMWRVPEPPQAKHLPMNLMENDAIAPLPSQRPHLTATVET